MNKYDLIVIGGGPAGATAAIYAARNGKRVAVIEKNFIGGQILNTSCVENIPGFLSISGIEFGLKLEEQLNNLSVDIYMQEVSDVVYVDDKLMYVTTSDGNIYYADAFIIAVGSSYRNLNVPGEKELIGNGVHFCVQCDGAFYKDKRVVVIGGGNSAVTAALELSNIAKSVSIIQDLDYLTAQSSLVSKVSKLDNVFIYKGYKVKSMNKTEDGLSIELNCSNDSNKMEMTMLTDGVFEAIGMVPNTSVFKNLNILDENGYIDLSTSKFRNIYAAGDCSKNTDLRQVVTACASGAIASVKVFENS